MNRKTIRINKYIAESGHCSRREADKLIQSGKVKIGNKLAKLGDVMQKRDVVKVGNKVVKPVRRKIYILYNKPVGFITTASKESTQTIYDHIRIPERVFPVGRLDVATSGLLLLTNDGRVVNRMLKGRYGHEKEYVATVDKEVTKEFLEKMCKGIVLEERKTLPASAKKIAKHAFSLVLTEGRNRQIRRMCEELGYAVKKLQRVRILHLKNENLLPGKWRYLTDKEAHMLLRTLHIAAKIDDV